MRFDRDRQQGRVKYIERKRNRDSERYRETLVPKRVVVYIRRRKCDLTEIDIYIYIYIYI